MSEVATVNTTRKRVRQDAFCVHCGYPGADDSKTMEVCPQCSHQTKCPSCGLCNIHKEIRRTGPKPTPTTQWLVSVEFFLVKGQQRKKGELVVNANGMVGAVANGLRALKKELLAPRVRVATTKFQVTRLAGTSQARGK